MEALVSVKWLSENLEDKNLIVLDATLQKPANGASVDNTNLTIPGARFFDIKNTFSDTSSAFPNTFPSKEQFEIACQQLGINQNSTIIVFDQKGVYSSPRVWWMFKAMGHENIAVLNGGLPAWKNDEQPVELYNPRNYTKGNFIASNDQKYVIQYEEVIENLINPSFTIVDARSEGRFNGIDPEPRKHLKSGSIPNSINVPYTSVLENGSYKSKSSLQQVFEGKVEAGDQLVFSCGSGITACIILLAWEIAHTESRYVFDGSWTEWAERQKLINSND